MTSPPRCTGERQRSRVTGRRSGGDAEMHQDRRRENSLGDQLGEGEGVHIVGSKQRWKVWGTIMAGKELKDGIFGR
uniref:Uncharacterized protein n=1 Tax=Arundo donax TaxID=35708 RepID=A0A0A8Z9B6_ARUDO